jgi:thiamine-phosphate pyrophosphorylase
VRSLTDCRLYAFVDSGYLDGRDPGDLARQLCDGGADLIQLRAKDWSSDQIMRTADQLAPICESAGVLLVINDRPEIAAQVGAPLAHLGQEDFFDAGHTKVTAFPSRLTPLGIGLSTHSPSQAQRAVAAGAAYVAVGPVFATPTKPGRPPVTLDYVRWAAANLSHVPWFAIGGIHFGNLDEVLAAGATRICVVSAILRAPDVAAACRDFRRRLPA